MTRVRRVFELAAMVGLVVACTSGPPTSAPAGGSAPATASSVSAANGHARGGTLKVAIPEEAAQFLSIASGEPYTLDPHLDLFGAATVLRCCLARTLVSHNGRSTGEGGSELHPDLAQDLPEVSPDGLTWTFRLRKGLRYGPPLDDVEIRAADFVRSLHRALSPALEAPDLFLYSDVAGAREYAAGETATITGLEAPDDHTLVIRLVAPAGDLGARLALSSASPLPPNPADAIAPFGVAQGHDDGYGRGLVSSGPYMIDDLDPGHSLTLVRNPSWDMANDPLRPAYVDRIEMTVGGTAEDAVAALEAGVMDVVWNPIIAPTLPATAVAAFEAANGPGRVHVDDYDYVSSVAMNLAVPPFDDVHVRKAVNHAVDKRSLIDALGGPLAVDAAGHLAIDSLEANLLLDRHFYGAADRGADVEAARAEMTLSRYDSDGDGRCDSQTCEGIPVLARGDTAEIADSVREDLAEIGIAVAVEVMPPRDVYPRWYDPRSKVAMLIGGGWSKAYLGAASFFAEQFYGPFLGDQQGNGTLVGAASDQLQAWGYDVTDVPNVDRRIEGCIPLVGDAQFECWAALDQYMMEEVVPVAPYAFGRFVTVTSDRVADYAFDQLTTGPAFEQIALNQ